MSRHSRARARKYRDHERMRLRKIEVVFIGNRLLQIDLTVMEAFITKEIDTSEYHVNCYPTRKTLWMYLKSKWLRSILNHYLSAFCQLYKECSTGASVSLVFLLSGISELPV